MWKNIEEKKAKGAKGAKGQKPLQKLWKWDENEKTEWKKMIEGWKGRSDMKWKDYLQEASLSVYVLSDLSTRLRSIKLNLTEY